MRYRTTAARICLLAALCAVIGVPGLHAVLHEIEEYAHEHSHEHVRVLAGNDHPRDHHDHPHGGDHARDHQHPHEGDEGDRDRRADQQSSGGGHHHHHHGSGEGPLHGQGAPEHLQLALTEAPPPPVAPIPEIADADEPIQLVDRLVPHELEPTRSSRGPPLTRV